MECGKLANKLDVLDLRTTFKYDIDGNELSFAVDQSVTMELAKQDGTYRFNGMEFDVDEALQFDRARCFDPTAGLWLDQEPFTCDAGQDCLFPYPRQD